MESFLYLMSGPLAALIRYGITAAGGAMVARGYVDASTAQAVVGGLIAGVPAVVGAITSTKVAAAAKVLRQPNVAAIKFTDGRAISESVQAPAMNDR